MFLRDSPVLDVVPGVSWFDHGLSMVILVDPGLASMGSLRSGTCTGTPKAKAGHDYTKLEEELRFKPGLTAPTPIAIHSHP